MTHCPMAASLNRHLAEVDRQDAWDDFVGQCKEDIKQSVLSLPDHPKDHCMNDLIADYSGKVNEALVAFMAEGSPVKADLDLRKVLDTLADKFAAARAEAEAKKRDADAAADAADRYDD